jgi:CRISPR-associated protein (TIGR02584 family)
MQELTRRRSGPGPQEAVHLAPRAQDAGEPRRRVLLAVTGLSPQIVTETIYALAVDPARPAPWVPEEVHLITTLQGANSARLLLLHPETGWFHRLRQDYALPEIRFDESCIHTIDRPDGSPLEDIRDDADNRLAADAIADWVRRFTDDPACELHASIAGGRKTMGFFLGYAMSLYGRAQDRLSHVLVSEHYESSREFFYPTPYSRVVARPGSRTEVLDTSLARVWLGDIPFVRLRSELDERTRRVAGAAFLDAIQSVQERLTPSRLVLQPRERLVLAGRHTVRLRPVDLAMLLWVVDRQRQQRPVSPQKVACAQAQQDAEEFLAIYQSLLLDPDEQDTRTHVRLRRRDGGLLFGFFHERLSRIKQQFSTALGSERAAPYLIRREGPRGRGHYVLPLPAEDIRIAEFSPTR